MTDTPAIATPTHNPYRLPVNDEPGADRFYAINFSGGRSSAYMLYRMVEAHGGRLPGNCRVIFANTGKETQHTLDFIDRVDRDLDLGVVWLEYDWRPEAAGTAGDWRHVAVETDHRRAARRGEPFEKLIRAKKFLPNATQRLCTSELKVETIRRWVARRLRQPRNNLVNVLGIRYDEPRRWKRILAGDDCRLLLPMVFAKVVRLQVDAFWARRTPGFDLDMPSELGNCDLCFMKSTRTLLHTIRQEPHRLDWWKQQEAWVKSQRREPDGGRAAQFSIRRSCADLERLALQGADPGAPDDDQADCFCGV